MEKKNTIRISLDEVAAMQKNGELYHNPTAPIGTEFGTGFWDKAIIIRPQSKTYIRLVTGKNGHAPV